MLNYYFLACVKKIKNLSEGILFFFIFFANKKYICYYVYVKYEMLNLNTDNFNLTFKIYNLNFLKMTPTATQEDDLIILSDTVTPSFDQTPIVSAPLNEENNTIISFDTDSLLTPAIDVKLEEVPQLQAISNNELNLDSQVWFLFWETPKQEEKVEQTVSTTTDNLFWDFVTPSVKQIQDQWLVSLEQENNLLTDSPVLSDSFQEFTTEVIDSTDTELWDMNSILDATILKLQKRQSWIASTKTWKLANITDLESQIKELKEQVSVLKKEVEDLDEENTKIEVNVSTLESMKLWQNIKVPTKPREHNIKRVAKVI